MLDIIIKYLYITNAVNLFGNAIFIPDNNKYKFACVSENFIAFLILFIVIMKTNQ